jgi:dTMP kinase
VLLDPAHKGMEALTEFFLFQASRAQFIRRMVKPLAAQGADVVLDRYSLSSMAYQIAGRRLPLAPCLSAIELATGGLVPDITFLLICSYETGRERLAASGKAPDRLEAEDARFHRTVIKAYEDFARLLPAWNIHTIETDGLSPERVYGKIQQTLASEFDVVS